jgi:toxin FitB
MFVLDTNVISALRQPQRADPRLRAWAASRMENEFFLSAITILEIELGTLRVGRRDQVQAARFRDWIDNHILPSFAGKILPVDVEVARRCASLHVPDPCPERDAFIAATALIHGFTVVTRNVRDFEPMGVPTLNPWAAATTV